MLAGMRHLEEETGGSFDAQGGPTPGGALDGGPSRGAEGAGTSRSGSAPSTSCRHGWTCGPVSSAQSGLDRYTAFAVGIEPGRRAPTKPSQMAALGR
jgi:hypothetical protein